VAQGPSAMTSETFSSRIAILERDNDQLRQAVLLKQSIITNLDAERTEMAAAIQETKALVANLEGRLTEQQKGRAKLELALEFHVKKARWLEHSMNGIITNVKAVEKRKEEISKASGR
jgi:chromosome segregation ATPase